MKPPPSGGYQPLLVLPTPGRIYLHPRRTHDARWHCIGTHDVITTAIYLQRDKPARPNAD